jgi:pyrroline-5-carboxylate reductase
MKLGFIGLGNMAGTICQGVIESGFIKGEDVCGFDINQDKLTQMEKDYGMCVCTSERDLVEHSDYVLMGVKPNVIESVLDKVKDLLDDKTIISIVDIVMKNMKHSFLEHIILQLCQIHLQRFLKV